MGDVDCDREPTPEEELEYYRRLEQLDELLPMLAGVLDLRDVFEKVGEVARRVLPHDYLVVSTLDFEADTACVYAIAGGRPPGMPNCKPLREMALPPEPWEYEILDDITSEASSAPPWLKEKARRDGLRAWLRLPIRLDGKLSATLTFTSREAGAFSKCAVFSARRIRDHVALSLAHQRLAEEAHRSAEARERAAKAEARVKTLTDELAAVGGHGRVVGESKTWKAALTHAAKVAPTETTVLVTGESGTGKEVLARFIHRGSPRAQGPFVAINCAALPEALLESELFGFERGAFSGAVQAKPGRIEQAAGGLLFLDEIGEMSLAVQAKLLRFLQEREFQRLGGNKPLKADVRVVAATNRDLKVATERAAFREDLYYRVSVFEIRTPPLRERPDDVLALAEVFLDDIGRALGRPPAGISREARDRLLGYRWPGNVRELRNVLERASILCEGGLITGEHLAISAETPAAAPAQTPAPALAASPLPAAVATPRPANGDSTDLGSMERTMIERVLAEVRFNKSLAAKRLGISRGQLYQRLRKYGLDALA